MPFALRFTYEDGSIKEIKPIAADNPSHDFESQRIATNANRIAGKINKGDNDFKCSVVHYTEGNRDSEKQVMRPPYREGL